MLKRQNLDSSHADVRSVPVDVLCVGHASYDLTFSVSRHPEADEKTTASAFVSCGGGPAANAAVVVTRLGRKSAFAGYLSNDVFGEWHMRELEQAGVDCRLIVRGEAPSPLSTVLVKPDGQRALVNYRQSDPLPEESIDFSNLHPEVILFDGHEPHISQSLAARARSQGIPTVLDAGSLHAGTEALMTRVDYLVCSEKFARQFSGQADTGKSLDLLSSHAPNVVITLGESGIVWKREGMKGNLPAFKVDAVDTTGAGDAFHGAFAAALAEGLPWLDILRLASAVAALSCAGLGARSSLPTRENVNLLLSNNHLTY